MIDLGFRPRPWQEACFRKLRRFNVLVVHRRGGKTILAIMLLISRALCATTQSPRYAYVGPEKAQAKKTAWDYLKRYAVMIPGTRVSEVELYVEFSNGARITIEGADDPDRMRGIYLDGVVMDELADMKPSTWGEVIRPTLSDRIGWALFIGTPKGLNLLSELYYRAQSQPDWFAARYTIDDTHAVADEEVESNRRSQSPAQFAQEWMCDFTAGASDTFLTPTDVDAAMGRGRAFTPSDPLIMGVDVARFGEDESVIWFRRGRDAATLQPIFLRGADTMAVAARVCVEAQKHGVDAIFLDESGVGGGVVDRCRQLGMAVIGINNGSSSDCPLEGDLVSNKGAECWCRGRQWIRSGGALPLDSELRVQLCARKYTYNAHNEIVLERKADMRKRGLSSPDRADALMLTFAFPVAPRAVEGDQFLASYMRAPSALQDYDPMKAMR